MLGKELAMKFAKERLMVNGKKKFHEALPKLSFEDDCKIYKSGEEQQAAYHRGQQRYIKSACQSFC